MKLFNKKLFFERVGESRSSRPARTIKTVSAIVAVVLVLSGLIVSLTSFDNTQKAQAAWYNASWNYRQKIIIDHNKVPNTDQTDFPVLIKITDANNAIFTKAQADGDDLLFTSSNEITKLSHEIETFTTTLGSRALWAWVKIPTLSHTTDTVIYLYYGNPSATSQQTATDVWSNGYAGVWHSNDATTSTINDSLGVNNGTKTSANNPIEATGKIGKAQDYTSDYVNVADSASLDFSGAFSMEYWVKFNNVSSEQWIVSKGGGWNRAGFFSTIGFTSGKLRFGMGNGSAEVVADNTGFATATWYHIFMTYDGTTMKVYSNGSLLPNTNTNAYNYVNNYPVRMGGSDGAGPLYLAGSIDETSVSSTARSADWIATEYANQNSPETFMHINGEVGKDNYTIPTQPAGWYAPDWAKRQPITINHALVPNTDQTDFPTLIKLTDVSNDLWASAQADGDDILFADASGNKLAHELESFSTSSKYMWAWVKIPSLSHTVDTVIYMHYGNANAPNQQSRTAVWSNGYVGVWHLKDATTSTINDSLGVNNGTKTAANSPLEADAKIGKGQNFSGLNKISAGTGAAITGSFTLDVWINPVSNAWSNWGGIIGRVSIYHQYYIVTTAGTSGILRGGFYDSTSAEHNADSTVAVANGVWSHAVLVFNSSAQTITWYINNQQAGQTTGVTAVPRTESQTVQLGLTGDNYVKASSLDNANISSTARSADWIATEYNNQNDPGSFETFGAMENPDTFAPNNPSAITALYSAGGSPILLNSGSDSTPYYSWPEPEAVGGATDQTGAYISGVAGYYSYFGTSCGGGGADPEISRGVLSDTGSGLHYSSDTNISIPDLTTNEDDYCFRIKTKDNAGNVSAVTEVATYNFDTTAPNAPTFVASNPAGYSSVNSFDFTWPTSSDVAGPGSSGIAGYQYKRGGSSGDDWSATQVATSKTAILSYQTGENIFLVRSVDNAGNTSDQVQTTYYYSNDVPTKPTAVTPTPGVSDANSFAFSWTAPVHSRPIVDYGYSINAVPTLSNLTWTGSDATTLAEDAFATIQGVNTFYIVAKDDSGAYGVAEANYGTATFTCTTVAPPIPVSVSITDSSNRTIDLWALTIKWSAGVGQTTPPFDHYSIERATDPSASSGSTAFTEIATSTSTAYIDATGLNNTTTYYYRVKAVDNAGATSAASSTVSKMPTGKYTTPPTIITEPSVSIKATQATISWVASRISSSAVRFGTTQSDLSRSQIDPELETAHSISLVGLTPGTRYYYQVQSLDEYRDYTSESAYSVIYNFTTLVAPNIANVVVSNITLTTTDISWETSSASNTKVHYGTTIGYGTAVPENSSSMTTMHTVKLIGLADTTKYHFKILGPDIDGNILSSDDYVFETLPMPVISGISYQPDLSGPEPATAIYWTTNVPTSSSVEYSRLTGDQTSYREDQSELITQHKVLLSGLANDTQYRFYVSGSDQFGNFVRSDMQILLTNRDNKPPGISGVYIETSNVGIIDDKARVIVSWKTDEPATTQVEYNRGISGDDFALMTGENSSLTMDHSVVVSGLDPLVPFRLRVVSKDRVGNVAKSPNAVFVTGEVQQSIMILVTRILKNVFGWVGVF